jgi:hypothetical protein
MLSMQPRRKLELRHPSKAQSGAFSSRLPKVIKMLIAGEARVPAEAGAGALDHAAATGVDIELFSPWA